MYRAMSKSDPNGSRGGLTFHTEERAEKHQQQMNALIEQYPNKPWNVDFWKSKPENWIIVEE